MEPQELTICQIMFTIIYTGVFGVCARYEIANRTQFLIKTIFTISSVGIPGLVEIV